MNLDVKMKWVAALRSGEYRQAKKALRVEDEYCCLGVLCELYRRETGRGEWFNDLREHGVRRFKTARGVWKGWLPDEVQDWAGCTHDPIVLKKPLSSHNDKGTDFPTIADLIEEHL